MPSACCFLHTWHLCRGTVQYPSNTHPVCVISNKLKLCIPDCIALLHHCRHNSRFSRDDDDEDDYYYSQSREQQWQSELRQRREEERTQRRREKVPLLHMSPVWVVHMAHSTCHFPVAFSPAAKSRNIGMIDLKTLALLLRSLRACVKLTGFSSCWGGRLCCSITV